MGIWQDGLDVNIEGIQRDLGCVEREDKCEIEGIERDGMGWERNEMEGMRWKQGWGCTGEQGWDRGEMCDV